MIDPTPNEAKPDETPMPVLLHDGRCTTTCGCDLRAKIDTLEARLSEAEKHGPLAEKLDLLSRLGDYEQENGVLRARLAEAERRAEALEDVLAARLIDDGMSALAAREHVAVVQRAALTPTANAEAGRATCSACIGAATIHTTGCPNEPKPGQHLGGAPLPKPAAEEGKATCEHRRVSAQGWCLDCCADTRAPKPDAGEGKATGCKHRSVNANGWCFDCGKDCRPKPDAGEARGAAKFKRLVELANPGDDASPEVRATFWEAMSDWRAEHLEKQNEEIERLKAELAEANRWAGVCQTERDEANATLQTTSDNYDAAKKEAAGLRDAIARSLNALDFTTRTTILRAALEAKP